MQIFIVIAAKEESPSFLSKRRVMYLYIKWSLYKRRNIFQILRGIKRLNNNLLAQTKKYMCWSVNQSAFLEDPFRYYLITNNGKYEIVFSSHKLTKGE